MSFVTSLLVHTCRNLFSKISRCFFFLTLSKYVQESRPSFRSFKLLKTYQLNLSPIGLFTSLFLSRKFATLTLMGSFLKLLLQKRFYPTGCIIPDRLKFTSKVGSDTMGGAQQNIEQFAKRFKGTLF